MAKLFQLVLIFYYVRTLAPCNLDEPECLAKFVESHCIVPNVEYAGYVIETSANVDIEACNNLCQANPVCDHAFYDQNSRICCTKSKIGAKIDREGGTYVIPKYCVPKCSMSAVDYAGNDLVSSISVENYRECQLFCQQEAQCVLALWLVPWNTWKPKRCFLKSKALENQRNFGKFVLSMPKYCLYDLEERNGWYKWNGGTYKFAKESLTWSDAIAYCSDQGGQLASFSTLEELNFARSIAVSLFQFEPEPYISNFGIGLFQTPQGQWKWLDGSNLEVNLTHRFWCFDNPIETQQHAWLSNTDGICAEPWALETPATNVICEAKDFPCYLDELSGDHGRPTIHSSAVPNCETLRQVKSLISRV